MVDLKCSDSFCYAATTLSHTRTRTHSSPTQTIAACWVEFPVLPGRSPLARQSIRSRGQMPVDHTASDATALPTRLQIKQVRVFQVIIFQNYFSPLVSSSFTQVLELARIYQRHPFFGGGFALWVNLERIGIRNYLDSFYLNSWRISPFVYFSFIIYLFSLL